MLELHDLHKRYGDVTALDGCSFTARPGRMLGFLGRNGAGKTTAMRAVFGLLRPDAGEIRWHGRPVTAEDRLRFGYMPEERGLYPNMTAVSQLRYLGRLHGMAAGTAQAEAERWLVELDLGDRMDADVKDLSQGNQQRVQLAAALMHDPELLVLDEPFNGLDPIAAATMARVLRERAAAGTAVVFSSHQLDVVEGLCEDVAIIERGRIALTGEVARLKRDAPHRVVEVEVPDGQLDGPLGRLRDLEGVIDATSRGGRHVLTVQRDLDVHRLLAAVGAAEHVEHLVFTTPSLADIFEEAIR